MREFLENHSRAEMFESDIEDGFILRSKTASQWKNDVTSCCLVSLRVCLFGWVLWRYKCRCVAKKRSIVDVYFPICHQTAIFLNIMFLILEEKLKFHLFFHISSDALQF